MPFASPVESVRKEGSCQETPSSLELSVSANAEACSYIELTRRKRSQKYAWLDDGDDEEEEEVSGTVVRS